MKQIVAGFGALLLSASACAGPMQEVPVWNEFGLMATSILLAAYAARRLGKKSGK